MAGQQQADDGDPVAESMDDHDHRDDDAEPASDGKTGRQGDAVEEAVDAHPARPDDPDVSVRGIAVIELGGRLVSDVDRRELLDHVEREEAERGREHDLVEPADQVDGLGDQVEEGRTDPDAGTDGDDDADPADGAKRDHPAEEGGEERGRGDQEGGYRHRPPALGCLAVRTDPEQLEAVIVDPEAGLAGDIANDRAQAGVVDLAGPPAARADDMVVMRGLAADVGVLAVRQVETFDGADPFEQVEGAEDGGPPDGGTGGLRGGDQLGGREMAVLLGDQRGQRAPRLRHAVAGAVEGSRRSGWGRSRRETSTVETQSHQRTEVVCGRATQPAIS